MTNIDKV